MGDPLNRTSQSNNLFLNLFLHFLLECVEKKANLQILQYYGLLINELTVSHSMVMSNPLLRTGVSTHLFLLFLFALCGLSLSFGFRLGCFLSSRGSGLGLKLVPSSLQLS